MSYKEPKVGRPPMYSSVDQITGLIEKYFKDCQGVLLKNKDDEVVMDKLGQPVYIGAEPATVTGLALALGFNTRQGLITYEGKAEFQDAITQAKTRCQRYAEKRLYDSQGSNGAKFSLMNNFGWRDKQEVESINTNINADITDMTDEELAEQVRKMREAAAKGE